MSFLLVIYGPFSMSPAVGSRLSYVGNKGYDLSRDAFTVRLGNALELVLCTPDDIDFGAVDGECLDGHEANARAFKGLKPAHDQLWDSIMLTSSSYQSDFVLNVEQIAELKVGIIGCLGI